MRAVDGRADARRVWLTGYWMGWGESASARLLALYVEVRPGRCLLGARCICRHGADPGPMGHWN